MDDRNSRLPVPARAALPVRRPAQTPDLWRRAAPVVARGAALVAAGLIGEWLLRSAARRALNGASAPKVSSAKNRSLVPSKGAPSEGIIAVSETVVMTRRVIVRR